MIYDVIIIGAGPAGMSAGIYSARSGLKTLVLESKMPGGLINYTNEVKNYPGFKNISGPDLAMAIYDHFREYDIDYKNEEVVDLKNGKIKTVVTSKNEYEGKTVIIASGRTRRSLNLPNENELRGGGVSYCALCDGHFYKDKSVGVVGAGDSSLEEALYLANIVKNVTIIVRGDTLRANAELISRVDESKNIDIVYQRTVREFIIDEGKLTGVKLDDDSVVELSALFIYIGFDPVIPFESDLGLKTCDGYIVVDENLETNLEGVYAVGDIVKKDFYQIISAEYEGALAATAIARKLTKKN